MLFQPLPPTRYDLRFSIVGVPVRVHPLFWLIALLFGLSGTLLSIPIWIFVVFVSVLIHELGHAMAFRWYGIRSHIVLHAMGGLTIPETAQWGSGWANVSPSPKQEIVISVAGPFAGFSFAAIVMLMVYLTGGHLLATMSFGGRVMSIFVSLLLFVNVAWGLFNLLPVYPLDGGQITRNILIQFDPRDGARKSLWVSVISGGLIALISLFRGGTGGIYVAVLFGILAFQSYQALGERY